MLWQELQNFNLAIRASRPELHHLTGHRLLFHRNIRILCQVYCALLATPQFLVQSIIPDALTRWFLLVLFLSLLHLQI